MCVCVFLVCCRLLKVFCENHLIVESLKKTNKIIFIDEDVSGGATAYMLNEVITNQKGYYYLDAQPVCLTAKDHRPAYGSDGDYFSKPNNEDIVEAIYFRQIVCRFEERETSRGWVGGSFGSRSALWTVLLHFLTSLC